ncbi:Electron transfer flavoprotein ubiquinone oxidoreductase [Devosia sp. LC5]|uniref:electron transfer flavoprotein-ubiquinone oxidoreductase n=1 Tax=Devosia sp. LC5 TaxID=1502724 RepID=UPI0004E3341D|nr:electron transfer flavoprotein-ubiquinone oxidoreductase [Devosia sp. LC5]KFC66206.1 Electron transfer flavoprotein ubiquinone oxidoreductase [Devosia sp. LC5]
MGEREAISVDAVVVGAGPAGLSAAIRLAQRAQANGQPLTIMVLEKAAEIGGHILSGAVIDPTALDALIPDWADCGAPLRTPVSSDSFSVLTRQGRFAVPQFLLPPILNNHGNYVASLGDICRWLGEQAAKLGIDVFAGFAATELLYDQQGAVRGVATGDMGRDREGKPKPGFTAGMEIHARYTLIAEGARGSLAKQLIARFDLDHESGPQKYGIGIKEVWEVPAERHVPGRIEHTVGWPLSTGTGGGGFVYHGEGRRVHIGLVVHLNYDNPHLSPFDEMQRYKTHPHLRALLEGGERIAFGARAMTSGGWQSVPQLAFPGGALIGCSAGFMNLPRIKGTHNAMWSGIKTADALVDALSAGRGNDLIENLNESVTEGPIRQDLWPTRNAKPIVSRFGALLGLGLSGIDLWSHRILGRSIFGTLRHGNADHATLKPAKSAGSILYDRPDGKLTFDRASSVYLANLTHDEEQPVHLRLRDQSVPTEVNLKIYDEPAQRYCPAGVYEIVEEAGAPQLRINAANCVHCKTCDIKDPSQNIDWVPPEGGSGPNYVGM